LSLGAEPGFSGRAVRLAGLPASEILALAPIPDALDGGCFVLDRAGRLFHATLAMPEGPTLRKIPLDRPLPTEHPETGFDFKRHFPPTTLIAAPGGRWLAWASTLGAVGGLIDTEPGQQTKALVRGSYHPDVSPFPLGFTSVKGRLILVHATDWNRLDALDVETGKRLTERGPTSYSKKQERPAHYLDYFHSSLSVSPSDTYLVTNGWVWHPVGAVMAWRTDAWLGAGGNVWESEDGPTKNDVEGAETAGFWDRPLCWQNDETLLFWGRGDDDTELESAVGVYSLTERKLLRWLDGPDAKDGFLAFDQGRLIAVSPTAGTSVWDIESGARLVEDTALAPFIWHPGIGALLSRNPDDTLQLTHPQPQ
jgi:hypothetical protein